MPLFAYTDIFLGRFYFESFEHMTHTALVSLIPLVPRTPTPSPPRVLHLPPSLLDSSSPAGCLWCLLPGSVVQPVTLFVPALPVCCSSCCWPPRLSLFSWLSFMSCFLEEVCTCTAAHLGRLDGQVVPCFLLFFGQSIV